MKFSFKLGKQFIMSKLTSLPPRKISTSSKTNKQDVSPLQILLQMGFPRHRALKALAATGNRSVQLASDWLLTHVNDASIDIEAPREYILYACPTGQLLNQLHDFWEKSKSIGGWNGAHNFPPHITLVSFFKAPDESSLQLGKAVKHVVETIGVPPASPLKLEPYISQNFMGLFVSDEHADYLRKIAVHYVKEVSSSLGVSMDTYERLDTIGTCFPWCTMPQQKLIRPICLEPHVKSLHITLAYHFNVTAFDGLKQLVNEMQPVENSDWELRLYSRDPKFANHQLYKVTQGYAPKECDELELVIGDYIYVDEKEFDSSPDGWVQGTSWLTGVSGFLPPPRVRRTADADAWTIHRALALSANNNSDSKSESDSNTDGEMASNYPHEDADKLGFEKSEETYQEWKKFWTVAHTSVGIVDSAQDSNYDLKASSSGEDAATDSMPANNDKKAHSSEPKSRWLFAMRHGERVDLTYGQWVPHCFTDDGRYTRKDLNMPVNLPERAGGKDAYIKDTPLTRVGRLQAELVGEGLRYAGLSVTHVYASSALRCVETAHYFLKGLQADPSVKIRVDQGLFEFKLWHLTRGPMGPFMTIKELHDAGYNVDLDYKPYAQIDTESPESVEEFYERGRAVMQGAARDTEDQGGNVIFVGHAATLDMAVVALSRLNTDEEHPPYQLFKNLLRVPYCALAALRDKPYRLVAPPCPPSINSSSGRFNWKMLQEL